MEYEHERHHSSSIHTHTHAYTHSSTCMCACALTHTHTHTHTHILIPFEDCKLRGLKEDIVKTIKFDVLRNIHWQCHCTIISL